MEANKKSSFSLGTFAILLMFMATSGGTFENPAIQTTIEAWPQVSPSSIMMMITIPNITSMVAMVLFGAISGKLISYRLGNIIALVCSVVGGLLPIFYCPSWGFMLVMRGILGIAVGYYGVRNALLIRSVDADQTTKFIGYGGIINGITSTVAGPIVGFLTGFGWNCALWINGIMAIIGIANLLWLKEPEKEERLDAAGEEQKKERTSFAAVVYVYIALQFLHVLCIYPMLLGVSTYVMEKGIGSAVAAGALVAIFQASGLIINFILPWAQKWFGKTLLAVSFFFSAAGLALILFVPNIVVIGIGAFMVGIGFLMMLSMLQVYNGMVSNVATVTLASTIILAANQVGVFCSPFFMSICGGIFGRASQVESAFMGGIIVLTIIGIILFLFRGKVCPEK